MFVSSVKSLLFSLYQLCHLFLYAFVSIWDFVHYKYSWPYNPRRDSYSEESNLWCIPTGLFWGVCIRIYRSVHPPEHGPSSRIIQLISYYSKKLLQSIQQQQRPAFNWPSKRQPTQRPAKTWPLNPATRPAQIRPTYPEDKRPARTRPIYPENKRPAYNRPIYNIHKTLLLCFG